MTNLRERRIARWERIKEAGIVRFVIIRALAFALLLFLFSRAYGNPPFPWYWILIGQCAAGVAYGLGSWFITMRRYARARGQC